MAEETIHILGASGSGTSTLGRALAGSLGWTFLDTDDYYWKRKYDQAEEIPLRLAGLERDLARPGSKVLAGSLCGWGDPLIGHFDRVVFLFLARDTRMERLAARERERYGPAVDPGGSRHREHVEFLDWARAYEDGTRVGRNLARHESWLASLPCPVLRIDDDPGVPAKVDRVRTWIGR